MRAAHPRARRFATSARVSSGARAGSSARSRSRRCSVAPWVPCSTSSSPTWPTWRRAATAAKRALLSLYGLVRGWLAPRRDRGAALGRADALPPHRRARSPGPSRRCSTCSASAGSPSGSACRRVSPRSRVHRAGPGASTIPRNACSRCSSPKTSEHGSPRSWRAPQNALAAASGTCSCWSRCTSAARDGSVCSDSP